MMCVLIKLELVRSLMYLIYSNVFDCCEDYHFNAEMNKTEVR